MDTISAQSREYRDRLRQTITDEITSLEAAIRDAKSRLNDLAPISRLPPETLASIFTHLSASECDGLEWICVAHVCRRWRETALNHPRVWSHIDLTKLTSAGMAEVLSRAKMAPLHLRLYANASTWRTARAKALKKQLKVHISHTYYLTIAGYFKALPMQLVSPAPILESLSLLHCPTYGSSRVIIPDNFLNSAAPNLTTFHLERCDISWKSPLLKGLRNLRILEISTNARPKLEDWLDAISEMLQLKALFLHSATPLAPLAGQLIPEPSHTVTLPSLTHFHIHDWAKDCALALAHLILPALTWLHVDVESEDQEGEDVRLVIPYVARNVYVLQGIKPIRSLQLSGKRRFTEIRAWTTPGADIGAGSVKTLEDMSHSACLTFSATGIIWNGGVKTAISDDLLTHLPVNFVSNLTVLHRTRLTKKFWLSHAPRLPLLEQARLVSSSVGAFLEMLAQDTLPDSSRLPSLTRLIFLDVILTLPAIYHLRDMLIKRVEQGVPLEGLDLRTCLVARCAIQFLAEIVVDVQEPPNLVDAPSMNMEEFSKRARIAARNEFEYGDGGYPWFNDMDSEGEDEEEDEDEGESEGDDESDSDFNSMEYDANYYWKLVV